MKHHLHRHPHLGHHMPKPTRPPHHHGGHHHDEHVHPAHKPAGLLRQLQELRQMGASDSDLHDIIDDHVATSGLLESDSGRGSSEQAIDPLDRCRALIGSVGQAVDEYHTALRGKNVLAAGEFPPHFIEELLLDGVPVTQIHPLTHHGDMPPHFHHLARFGLRGLTELQGLTAMTFDVMLIHGAKDGNQVYVSPLVPIALQMFKSAEIYLLDDDYPAPHMTVVVAADGFKILPSLP